MSLQREIAFIDLTTRSVEIKPISRELRRAFLGGRGLNMHLLSRFYSPAIDPLSPHNPLIFGTGLLTGSLSFGSRMNITAKSPESGHLGDANMGGEFGAEMVKAGLSHLVITGRSPNPVYLYLEDGAVTIRDAQSLMGLDTIETQKELRRRQGDEKVQIACIGQAGENLVRFAAVRSGLKNAAGRTGMGAVMGSKNLKAVAARGHQDITIAEPQRYLRAYQSMMKKLVETKWAQALGKHGTPLLFHNSNMGGFLGVRNNQETTVGKEGSRLEAAALEEYSTGMVACYSCPVHCRHRFVIEEGRYEGTHGEGPEYASIGALGSKLGNLDLENILYAVELCNQYGMDTISIGSYIAWVMELYQRGIIDKDTTGIPLEWGDGDAIIELIHQIAHRRGFGDIVGEGAFVKEKFGKEGEGYLLAIKNFPIEMTDERLPKSLALGMATASRGACHMRSRPSIDVLGLPEEILKRIYGAPVSNELTSYRGKGRMVWWHERLNAVADSLGVCRFLTVFSSIHAPEYKDFAKLIRLGTGLKITAADLKTAGERICTLERMMLVKDGMTRDDDTLPARYFDEPIPSGPAKGAVISREKFAGMLDEYYRIHGWDKNGVPTDKTIQKLGLDA